MALSSPPERAYGADRFGLICAFLFEPGQSGRSLTLDEAAAWMAQAPQGAGFIWLHFNLSDAGAERWMREHLPVTPELFEAMREGTRSTRIEDVRDTLLAVVNDVAYEFAFEPSQIESLWVQVTPSLALTARLHPLRSIDRLHGAVRSGLRFGSSADFLNRLFADQGDVLVHIVRQARVQVDQIEDALLLGRLRRNRQELGQMRRVLVRLARLLAPEPAALFRLLRQPPPWLSADHIENLRLATEEFTLVLRDISELQERIKLLQEELAAQLSERTSRSLFTLTIVTVLALPINMVAGLFGMNVGGVPLSESPYGFAKVVLFILTVTALLAWFAFRRKD